MFPVPGDFSFEGPKLKHSSGSWAKRRHILNYIVKMQNSTRISRPLQCHLSRHTLIMIDNLGSFIFEEHFYLTIDTAVCRTGVIFLFGNLIQQTSYRTALRPSFCAWFEEVSSLSSTFNATRLNVQCRSCRCWFMRWWIWSNVSVQVFMGTLLSWTVSIVSHTCHPRAVGVTDV